MNYSFLHVLHIFMHPFLVPHKLENPAGKMLLSGEKFFFNLTEKKKKKGLEFKAVFLSHHNSTVTSMQNIMKNAGQCYKVENETWVCVYKDSRSTTLEFTQLKQRKYKIIL